jgi:hypothetical protein
MCLFHQCYRCCACVCVCVRVCACVCANFVTLCVTCNLILMQNCVYLRIRSRSPYQKPVLHCLQVLVMRLCSQMLALPHCYIACTGFFRGCARRCSPRRIACRYCFCGCARRWRRRKTVVFAPPVHLVDSTSSEVVLVERRNGELVVDFLTL